jgi:hypothetical protein
MLHLTDATTSISPSDARNADVVEPRMPLFAWLASSAPLAIGMSNGGLVSVLSIAIGIASPWLAAVATYRPRYGYAPPLCFVLLFIAAVGLLCFNSVAFVVDTWTTLLMAVTTIPRSRSTVACGAEATDAFAGEG